MEKQKVPGYYDGIENRYLFVGSGKGGKVFMTLWFKGGQASKRHRLNTLGLPIRYNVEDARADLAVYVRDKNISDRFPFKSVECVFQDNKEFIKLSKQDEPGF